MPVLCSDQSLGRQVAITCQYYYAGQDHEAWERSLERAATMAVSLGFSHVQYLHATGGVDASVWRDPTECKQVTGWRPTYRCEGGEAHYSYRSSYVTTHFALLTADDATARAADPLVPPERRPIDARRHLTERLNAQPSAGPARKDVPIPLDTATGVSTTVLPPGDPTPARVTAADSAAPSRSESVPAALLPKFRKCIAEALQRHPGLVGTVVLEPGIGADGAVTRVRVVEEIPTDRALTACLSMHLAGVTFPPQPSEAAGRPITIKVPGT